MSATGWTAIGSAATAIAAIFAAVSAYASLRATRGLEAELEANRRSSAYQLLEGFEASYREQYSAIMEKLGPWPDPDEASVDPEVRRVVHDLLVSLCSVYRSRQSELIPPGDVDYVASLFCDWLRNPSAKLIWTEIFRVHDSWPDGFVAYVDAAIDRPSVWDTAKTGQ